tara:strand:- start:239 stop:1291 length:1053 start_codon:yes stop_codon:yes gene_type:complete
MKFKIGRKYIGDKCPVIIVAELSGNHGGSFARIKKMIIKAKESGADMIKLQTYTADTITLNSKNSDFKINKNTPWKKNKNLWDLYNKASTPWSWHKKIFQLGRKMKIDIFSSPFDESAVDLLEKLNCPVYKIASAEINHIPLLIKVAKTKKPVIISIGLANLNEVKLAIKTLKINGCQNIIILKCVSSYPAPIEEQNLASIPELKKKFGTLVGLSDHTLGIATPITASVLGATLIEKHFNLKDSKKTVDSFFSINDLDFKKMVKEIRNSELSIGRINFEVSKSSKKNLNSKRSIYISKNIKKGDVITKDNIRVVRPSFGLNPKFFEDILGKKTNKNLFLGDRMKLKFLSK